MKNEVDCPICLIENVTVTPVIKDGYEIELVPDRQVVEYIAPQVTGWDLSCRCHLPRPPWLLLFPSGGIRPRFVEMAD